MSSKRPIIVISDLHLGRSGMVESAAMIQPIIEAAGTLIVNGDTAELHVTECRERAERELADLRERCARAGTRLKLLAGNHDPNLVDDRHLQFDEGRVFITHGDAIEESVAPWSGAAKRMRKQHRAFMAELPEEFRQTLEARFAACRSAAMREWDHDGDAGRPSTLLNMLLRPHKVARVLWYWATCNAQMDGFISEHAPESRLVLVGHSHRAGVFRRPQRTIINTGCYGFPGRPLGVVLDQTGARVFRIQRHGEQWALDTSPIYTNQSVSVDPESVVDEPSPVNVDRTIEVAVETIA